LFEWVHFLFHFKYIAIGEYSEDSIGEYGVPHFAGADALAGTLDPAGSDAVADFLFLLAGFVPDGREPGMDGHGGKFLGGLVYLLALMGEEGLKIGNVHPPLIEEIAAGFDVDPRGGVGVPPDFLPVAVRDLDPLAPGVVGIAGGNPADAGNNLVAEGHRYLGLAVPLIHDVLDSLGHYLGDLGVFDGAAFGDNIVLVHCLGTEEEVDGWECAIDREDVGESGVGGLGAVGIGPLVPVVHLAVAPGLLAPEGRG